MNIYSIFPLWAEGWLESFTLISVYTFKGPVLKDTREEIGINEGFLLLSTKKRGRNKVKVGEEMRNLKYLPPEN